MNKVKVTAHKYKNFNEVSFVSDLNDHNWKAIFDANDPSVAWDLFEEHFSSILDRHAPWKAMYFDNNLPAWVTREFLASCRERDNLKIFCDRTKRPEDRIRYNRVRNKHTQFARTLKRDYFITTFAEAGNDSKKLRKFGSAIIWEPKMQK